MIPYKDLESERNQKLIEESKRPKVKSERELAADYWEPHIDKWLKQNPFGGDYIPHFYWFSSVDFNQKVLRELQARYNSNGWSVSVEMEMIDCDSGYDYLSFGRR